MRSAVYRQIAGPFAVVRSGQCPEQTGELVNWFYRPGHRHSWSGAKKNGIIAMEKSPTGFASLTD